MFVANALPSCLGLRPGSSTSIDTFTYGEKWTFSGRDLTASDYLKFFASTIVIITLPEAIPLLRSKVGFLFFIVFSQFACEILVKSVWSNDLSFVLI